MAKAMLKSLPIDQLKRGQYQPREQFDEQRLQELALSIKANGVIQPIVVRPVDDKHQSSNSAKYEIIAGERRWRAAQLANLHEIPCLVNAYSNEQAAAVTTIENIQRVALNPIEEAQSYQQFIDEFHYTHEEISAMTGKPRSHVSNYLRLLTLDTRVKQLLTQRRLSAGHGKVLAGAPFEYQYSLAMQSVSHTWSVRKLEQSIKALIKHHIEKGDSPQADIMRLEEDLSAHLGTTVTLDNDQSKKSGWLKIRYYDYDTLSGVLEKLGLELEEA